MVMTALLGTENQCPVLSRKTVSSFISRNISNWVLEKLQVSCKGEVESNNGIGFGNE